MKKFFKKIKNKSKVNEEKNALKNLEKKLDEYFQLKAIYDMAKTDVIFFKLNQFLDEILSIKNNIKDEKKYYEIINTKKQIYIF